MSRGATEDVVAKLQNYEASDLPERTKVALRYADHLTAATVTKIDEAFEAQLRQHFTSDQILDLGMTIAFALGWQRFIESVGIVPDHWTDGAPPPFRPLEDGRR